MTREQQLCNGISPWLSPVAMVITQDLVLRRFFRGVTVLDSHNLPHSGPLLLAPTHRTRWDSLLLPHAAGRRVSGRDCRFMVTIDEMRGLQGWLLRRLGCFAVDQTRPSLLSLRYAVDLLQQGQQLVVFPEGRIKRDHQTPIRLQQGLARLALLARSQGVNVPVLPVGLAYQHRPARWRDRAAVCFGAPLTAGGRGRDGAQAFSRELAQAMETCERRACAAIGARAALAGAPDRSP
ncbi:MAG: lysophospholipid acyltransferase family protein [Cyanobacteriota bacterium]|nr:lysophospholipid acyltransferase family protein [Cyanobacteriota bacterium]